jgi:hypothetical protein
MDIAERRVLLTAIGSGDDGFVSYTPEGCYAGSNSVEAGSAFPAAVATSR